MKHTYFLMAASIGLLAGCSQMEQDFADVNSLTDGDLVEKVIFDVLPIKDGDAAATRASAVPAGGTVSFAWEENDMIGIYPNKGSQIYFTIEDGAGSSSATFDGGGWALKQNASYVSYYPFVADFFLSRDEIPVSFAGQKQIGTSSPFHGARYFLATEPTSSENGVLRFSYKTLNTIINVNATLPAGTYTKVSLTTEDPLFVEEGTYSLDDRMIVGTKFTNTLEIDLEDVVLTEETTIPIYIMSAPVDLKGKEVTVMVFSSDGNEYGCIKKPSKAYEAGTRYGLTCDEMVRNGQPVPEAVDLGLPSGIKWASFNLGASAPEEYGDYYAWGEIEPYYSNLDPLIWKEGKDEGYWWPSYRWCMGSDNTMTKYCSKSSYGYNGFTDTKTVLDPGDDAAHVNLGGKWRMPTDPEWQELLDNCAWTLTTRNGVNGCLITGSNGNSIFFPAAGYQNTTSLYDAGSVGNYWSSTVNTYNLSWAKSFFFDSKTSLWRYPRCHGRSVRPVYGEYKSVESVSLNKTSLSMTLGETQTLTATITPSNAPDKFVIWSSSDTSVATVDVTRGVVKAESAGSATITVTTRDGGKEATCAVTVVSTGVENGYEWVDLGLSSQLKWATCNVGASKPEEYGRYYAWGETVPNYNFSFASYKWCKGTMVTMTKYCWESGHGYNGFTDTKTVLDPGDDAAHVNLGGKWRMPTDLDWNELWNRCSWTWTTRNGVNGMLVAGRSGNSIFLPAAGYQDTTSLYDAGSVGNYWSSNLVKGSSYSAMGQSFDSGTTHVVKYYDRCIGLSVRPVCDLTKP